ncbi:MAG: UDP-3-O-(3-hydroxymyristoyl)glucosamine N-acyltransferase [Candidatus Cloacimonas sp.]|nr:UDP-3-O-(3-hydroxymyristoyl)glucosamine N-acyltransferase [Candidatus Cloacimonadota bacterium]
MREFTHKLNIKGAVQGLDGRLEQVSEIKLSNVSELSTATVESICFYESSSFLKDLADTKAGLIVVAEDFDPSLAPKTNLFYVKKPYFSFNLIVGKWLELEKGKTTASIHPSAIIDSTAILADDVTIRENVVIRGDVVIGKGTVIEANSVIEEKVTIGENTHLYPNCTVYARTKIGSRVILHSSCSIGVDGYGYLFLDGIHHKINHVGVVEIEDDVEIGANTCVDRATIGKTIVGRGTKIDNLVQVGHNCQIEKSAILCAQVGLAGNTKIGNHVFLAGQVGAAGHLKVNDGAMIGAQSGISNDVPAGAKYFGTPAIDAGLQRRILVSQKRLPELVKYFNKLEKEGSGKDK